MAQTRSNGTVSHVVSAGPRVIAGSYGCVCCHVQQQQDIASMTDSCGIIQLSGRRAWSSSTLCWKESQGEALGKVSPKIHQATIRLPYTRTCSRTVPNTASPAVELDGQYGRDAEPAEARIFRVAEICLRTLSLAPGLHPSMTVGAEAHKQASPEAVLQGLSLLKESWVQCDGCSKWRRVPKQLADELRDDTPW